ncbi:MAG: hydrogenase maturation protease [Burkholderiales bacterium]|nr:hydrogenase maturation protease [Burkholderiales bacterium]
MKTTGGFDCSAPASALPSGSPTPEPLRTSSPLLVFGWGNAGRGDDALGPLFIDRLRAELERTAPLGSLVECLDDYQLQVEHALDLVGRSAVLFIDASRSCAVPFEARPLQPCRDDSYSSHAMSPQALLQVYRELHGQEPPPCTLLAIRGVRFELGEPVSPEALAHLEAAWVWWQTWLKSMRPGGELEIGEAGCASARLYPLMPK